MLLHVPLLGMSFFSQDSRAVGALVGPTWSGSAGNKTVHVIFLRADMVGSFLSSDKIR